MEEDKLKVRFTQNPLHQVPPLRHVDAELYSNDSGNLSFLKIASLFSFLRINKSANVFILKLDNCSSMLKSSKSAAGRCLIEKLN